MERILARSFLILLVFAFSMVLLENLTPQLFGDPHRHLLWPVGFQHKPKPYTMFGGDPNSEELNDLGFRGRSPTAAKAPGEYRIFMLGGSTVYHGSPPLVELLTQLFHTNGDRDVRGYNLGVVSSGSGQDLARILYVAVDYKPDLIIAYNGGNDNLSPVVYDPRPGYPYNFVLYENNPMFIHDLSLYPKWTLFGFGTKLGRRFLPNHFLESLGRISETREEAGWGAPEWRDTIADAYISHMVKAQHVCRAFGIEFIVFFQPTLPFKNPLVGTEKAEEQRSQLDTIELSLAVRDRVLSAAASASAEDRLNFVDLSDIYDGLNEEIYDDEIHAKQSAKPRVARAMYDELRRRQMRINLK